MSYKLQYLPSSSNCETRLNRHANPSWGSLASNSPEMNLRDMELLRSWLVNDSVIQSGPATHRIKWNMVLGLGLATTISASIWAGLGLMIVRLWR
jgi:hypothetical protein